MPLLAPLANLVAAPIVAFTTLLGLVAIVLPIEALANIAAWASGMVLWIAERAALGPQLGVQATIVVGAIGALVGATRTRPIGIAAVCLAALLLTSSHTPWPSEPTVVVLDVGQGDAILVQDPTGPAVLVDGGRNPSVLDRALRRHGVRRLDALVVSHGDADHVGGLVGLIGPMDVGAVWIGAFNSGSDLMDVVLDEATKAAVPVRKVQTGDSAVFGETTFEVLGPRRRYLSDNDGSVVLLVSGRLSMLLPGDLEAVAQHDLPQVRPYAMVVPHHGSATTDTRWLEDTVRTLAVLSYGANTYGHPHPEVVGTLERTGVEVRHTFVEGDVVVPLG